MKRETLRLDRVTRIDQGAAELNRFCLELFAGDIVGLLPVNGTGLSALMRLLRQNTPIHYGFIYYMGKLVNHWRHSDHSYNRIGVIEARSGLADDLTVTDNVFVLRHGFGKRVINRGVLRRQLKPFLEEINVDISADAYIKDLDAFHRLVIELVKAIVAGSGLIVLADAGTIVSGSELNKLHDILRFYAARGVSFLYVSQHYDEIRLLCEKVALMVNGHIAKVFDVNNVSHDIMNFTGANTAVKPASAVQKIPPKDPPALVVDDLWNGPIAGLSLTVAQGECVVLQDLDNRIIDSLTEVIAGTRKPQRGRVLISGKEHSAKTKRDVAVIQRLAAATMLFKDLSYMDNLCFTMDHRLPTIWARSKPRHSVRGECEQWLGWEVFDMNVDELSQVQKYDLIYTRILLQRPKIVICVQPFIQADAGQRAHIWKLIERFIDKSIAVLILDLRFFSHRDTEGTELKE